MVAQNQVVAAANINLGKLFGSKSVAAISTKNP